MAMATGRLAVTVHAATPAGERGSSTWVGFMEAVTAADHTPLFCVVGFKADEGAEVVYQRTAEAALRLTTDDGHNQAHLRWDEELGFDGVAVAAQGGLAAARVCVECAGLGVGELDLSGAPAPDQRWCLKQWLELADAEQRHSASVRLELAWTPPDGLREGGVPALPRVPGLSPSRLFSLPPGHALSAEPEPEPEPEQTREEQIGTLLDHPSVRLGREVVLSQEDLWRVGRSKAVCQSTREFIGSWAEGRTDCWANALCHTGARDLQAWGVLTAAARAEKLRGMQHSLQRGRCLALGAAAEAERDAARSGRPLGPKPPSPRLVLEEEDVASLCLALLAAAVAKGHGFVSGSVVLEDPGHVLLSALSRAPAAYERSETRRGSRARPAEAAIDARSLGSAHMLDMVRWASLVGVVDHENDRIKPQFSTAYDVFAQAWEERSLAPLGSAEEAWLWAPSPSAVVAVDGGSAAEVLKDRLAEEKHKVEAPARRNRAVEAWRGLTPEAREPYEAAARAAAADAEAGRGEEHSRQDVEGLRRCREKDLAAGVPEWFVSDPGSALPFARFGYDFTTRPLLATRSGWVAPTIVFGKAPVAPGNAAGWGQAMFICWEHQVGSTDAVGPAEPQALALLQDANPAQRPTTPGGQVSLLALDRARGVPQHVRYASERERLEASGEWVDVGPCRSVDERPDSGWVARLQEARTAFGLDSSSESRCRSWLSHWQCERALAELRATGAAGAEAADALRFELLESLAKEVPEEPSALHDDD